MPNADDIKDLLDTRMKSGTVQDGVITSFSEKMLDPIEAIIEEGQQIRDPLTTTRPEDIRAKFDISGTPTGATLATAVTTQRTIGNVDDIQKAVEDYLIATYFWSAPPPTVVVTPHRDLDSRFEETLTVTIRIPDEDDSAVLIPTDEAGLVAEVLRVAPKWHVFIVNTTASRSANHIKQISTSQGKETLRSVDILPESPFYVEASSEHDEIVSRATKVLDWIEPLTAFKRADNIIDGEDQNQFGIVGDTVRLEVSSTSIDDTRTFTEVITPSPELFGGFPPKEPVEGGIGITGVFAKEKETLGNFNVAQDIISNGTLPSVSLLDPLEELPIEIVAEMRFITNDKKDNDILVGTHEIHHEYLTPGSSTKSKLAGQTIRIFAQPLGGGKDDKDRILSDTLPIDEQFIPFDPNMRKFPTGEIEVEFARQYFKGASRSDLNKIPVVIDQDQEFEFELLVSGTSPGSVQTFPAGAVEPGLISIPVNSPGSTKGIISSGGFLNITSNQYYNVQKFNAQTGFALITIKNAAGSGPQGSPAPFTEGLAVVETKPEFGMHPNSGECRFLSVVVPPFANLFSFSTSAATLIDMRYDVVILGQGIYERIELQGGDTPADGEKDVNYQEFSPNQVYKVIDTRLANLPGDDFVLEERQITNPLEDDTIVVHELKYDGNKTPAGGQQIQAFATYDITSEDNGEQVSISIPVPGGFICDYVVVDVKGGRTKGTIQQIIINLTDPNINTSVPGGTVFKSVHLDAVFDGTKSLDKSISEVLLFYDDADWTRDVIVSTRGHFVPYDPTVSFGGNVLEDLTSFTWSPFDGLPLTAVTDTLPTGALYKALYVEKDTGNILDSPIDKYISGATYFYWSEVLDDDGQFVEVFITYGDPVPSPAYKDIAILNVSIPEGKLDLISVAGITPEFLDYVDDKGVIHPVIDDYDVASVDIHYDKNKVLDGGGYLQVWGTYSVPSITSNSNEDFISFSTDTSLFLKSVAFEGLNPVVIKYDTVDDGIVDTLPDAAKCENVLVVFDGYNSIADKVQVIFKPTYLRPLKEVLYPIRQDWSTSTITFASSPLISVREAWVRGEFDKFEDLSILGVSTYREQRISQLRVLFYDEDLSVDEGDVLSGLITLGMKEITNFRFNPFVAGTRKWLAPSGVDEQYRIDLLGTKINTINVTGVTATASPIRIVDRGFNQEFIPGKEYEQPTSILLHYSEISDIEISFVAVDEISDHHRDHMLFDTDEYHLSNTRAEDERYELITGNILLMNQLIIDFHAAGTLPEEVYMRLQQDGRDFITKTILPSTAIAVSGTGFPAGATEISVDTTVGVDNFNIVDINGEFIRVRDVISSTVLRIDALENPIASGDAVYIVGYDFGDPFDVERIVLNMTKASSSAIAIRQLVPRLERRFKKRNLARNAIAPDTSYWSSAESDTPETSASIGIHYDVPVRANAFEIDEEIESDKIIKILEPDLEIEKEIFLSEKVNGTQFIYTDKDKVDNPEFAPEVVKFKSAEAFWESLPRNGDTGAYQTKVRKFMPKFVYDTSNSSKLAMLDGNILTRWSSIDTTNPADIMTVIFDLGQVYPLNRVLIVTPSVGCSATLEYSLANQDKGWQSWGSIADIGAPVTTVSQALTANVPPANQVTVADTTGFVVGRYVNVKDSASPSGIGEFRIISGLTPTVISFSPDLALTYTTANSATVEQSNILCPGWYPPIVVGEACVGDHILGPGSFADAFVMSAIEAQFVKVEFTDLVLEAGTSNRNVRLNVFELFNTVTVL